MPKAGWDMGDPITNMGGTYQPSSRDLMLIAALGDLLQADPKIPDDVSEWIKSKILKLKEPERINDQPT